MNSNVVGEAGADARVRAIASDLERQLARGRRRRWLRALGVVGVLGLAALAVFLWRRSNAPAPEPRFTTAPLERRDISVQVQATGVVEPVNKVEIGSQVSGRVVRVLVDFNDEVKEGQLLAEIDPNLLGAEVVQSRAQLSAARAQKARAEANVVALERRKVRLDALRAENLATPADIEQLEAELSIARTEVKSADAQIAQLSARVSSAETTLGYTKIYSPMAGVVIDRKVEPGQTVAASFNTPVLFVVARDLEEMRVLAEIDESDVGQVKEGMPASVVVDAFPDEKFEGALKQVRLSPNNVEGVVTYTAVITVKNRGGKLRPGLTATATIVPLEVKGVLAVKNAALRFEPLPPKKEPGAPEKKSNEAPLVLGPGERKAFVVGPGPVTDPAIARKVVRVGVSDGVWTEVLGGLAADERVIVDERPRDERRGPRLF